MRVTPEQAYQILMQRSANLEAAIMRAELTSAREGRRIAQQWSSGTFSLQDLARMNHPYATRHMTPTGGRIRGSPGIPYGDPAMINTHPVGRRRSGRFRAAWSVVPPVASGAGIHTEIINRTPYASFLETGTDRMIRRPIKERVLEILQPSRERRLKAAIKRTLSGR